MQNETITITTHLVIDKWWLEWPRGPFSTLMWHFISFISLTCYSQWREGKREKVKNIRQISILKGLQSPSGPTRDDLLASQSSFWWWACPLHIPLQGMLLPRIVYFLLLRRGLRQIRSMYFFIKGLFETSPGGRRVIVPTLRNVFYFIFILLYLSLLDVADTAFFTNWRFVATLHWVSWWAPCFLTTFHPFVPSCHILVILTIFQSFSLLLYFMVIYVQGSFFLPFLLRYS